MARDSVYVALVSVAVGVGLTAANGGLPGRTHGSDATLPEVAAPRLPTTPPTIELDTPPVRVEPRQAASLATSVVTATSTSSGPAVAAPAAVVNPQPPPVPPPVAPVIATSAAPPAPAPTPTPTPTPQTAPAPAPESQPAPAPDPAPDPEPAPDQGLLPGVPLPTLPLPLPGI